MRNMTVAMFVLALTTQARAETVRFDGALGFVRTEQQVKTEIGTARGERLVEHTSFTLAAQAAYNLHPYVAAIAFAELDLGVRRAGELAGFDAAGRATIDPAVGGTYSEVWSGIGVRGQYRALFVDIGYALFARRWDRGRDDLPNVGGDTNGAFAPTLTFRWLAAIGGAFRVTPTLSVTARLEWRIRYYDERGGSPLMNEVVHGTQEYRPLIGVAWRP